MAQSGPVLLRKPKWRVHFSLGASLTIRLASEPPDRPERAQNLLEGPENASSIRHGGFLGICPRTEMHPKWQAL